MRCGGGESRRSLVFPFGTPSSLLYCRFRPPNVRLASAAEEMEVGSHMEVLFLEQISSGRSDQASRAFSLPITAL